ncbi:cupredoxin-like domain protein [Bacteriovorax sp. BAL6_X]|uniref:cupredoxin domain-containing protein n=1 Tax=Bacteriovorax sp. BAL6_X TaxID=1201290 RepID=UPI0003856977|nr:cupredoxin domain-containing protein [Bacteriovorax sp. BAL6_X]EPZ50797.1 cupredoxin-like domain protein [Bacteriovorax sp. BAL6_X]
MKSIAVTLITLIVTSYAFGIKETYFHKQEFDIPKRDLSIIATDKGFFPSKVTAFVGEKLNLYVTAATNLPSCLILKEHEVYVEAKKGEVREASVFLDTPGRFKFYCPSGQISGTLTVIEHPREKAKKDEQKREIASRENERVRVWRPKDD